MILSDSVCLYFFIPCSFNHLCRCERFSFFGIRGLSHSLRTSSILGVGIERLLMIWFVDKILSLCYTEPGKEVRTWCWNEEDNQSRRRRSPCDWTSLSLPNSMNAWRSTERKKSGPSPIAFRKHSTFGWRGRDIDPDPFFFCLTVSNDIRVMISIN